MRVLATLLIIVLAGLPSLFAGLPGLAPDAFDGRLLGAPVGVVFMSALMLFFVLIAALCSGAARNAERDR